jgi:hypothetical protein
MSMALCDMVSFIFDLFLKKLWLDMVAHPCVVQATWKADAGEL